GGGGGGGGVVGEGGGERRAAEGGRGQRVAVGLRLRRFFRADRVAGAGAVVDDHGLAEGRGEIIADEPGDHIHRPARRRRHDDLDRPRRVGPGESCRKGPTRPQPPAGYVRRSFVLPVSTPYDHRHGVCVEGPSRAPDQARKGRSGTFAPVPALVIFGNGFGNAF